MRNTAINRNELMKSRLYLYANYKNLPDTLRYELMQDFESTFHKSYFNERLIMATVSGQLGQVQAEKKNLFLSSTFIKLIKFIIVGIARIFSGKVSTSIRSL